MILKPAGQQCSLPSEVRAEALKLLHAKGRAALNEVKMILGWDGPAGMPIRQMAQSLGITDGRLAYLLRRDYLREKAKERRRAGIDAKKIVFVTHTSEKNGFSISLPENWRVTTDTYDWSRLAQEYLNHTFRLKPENIPLRFHAYAYSSDDGGPRPLTELEMMQVAKMEHEERNEEAKRHARLEQMATGLFQAESLDDKDAAFVEVTKLRLDGLLTALDLYKLDKCLPENVPWGSRPSKAMIVDKLSGVVYYFILDTGDGTQELPVFFNVYLANGLEGWILSCQCRYGDYFFKTFTKYKPIFRHIISSFKRLSVVHTKGT